MPDITDGLTMEEIKQRLDHLEAVVKQSEGDPDRVGEAWDELKHLRQVYDRMIMDSQGRGIQMMQDIMDKSPETRENYVAGVPVPSTERPAGENVGIPAATTTPVAGAGIPPNISLTVNVIKEDGHMEHSLDTRAASLEKSDCGDVRIPLNMQADLLKARKLRKEKKDSVDGVDQDKIRAMKQKEKGDKKKEGEEEGEPEEAYGTAPVKGPGGDTFKYPKAEPKAPAMTKPSANTYAFKSLWESFARTQTETLQKAIMAQKGSKPSMLAICGAWCREKLTSGVALDTVAKSMRNTIEKCAGATIVGGLKAPTGAPKASAHAHIVGLNAEIQTLQEKISGCSDPEMQVKYDRQLRSLMERLATCIVASEGLGIKTEDLMQANTRKVDVQPGIEVGKSQKSQDLEKAKRHFTGKVGSLKYALTVWGAEGGLCKEQARAIVHKVASTDKAVARRLGSKLPPLPKSKEDAKHYINADSDNGGGERGGSKSGKHDHQGGQKHNHGKHLGQMKHIISGGKGKGKK
jgi:hypothetical protein